MTYQTPPQAILVKVKYLPPTNFRPARVKLEAPAIKRYRILELDHTCNHIVDQTNNWLNDRLITPHNIVVMDADSNLCSMVCHWDYRDKLLNALDKVMR